MRYIGTTGRLFHFPFFPWFVKDLLFSFSRAVYLYFSLLKNRGDIYIFLAPHRERATIYVHPCFMVRFSGCVMDTEWYLYYYYPPPA